jgi:ribosomal protein S18 acetylase RimI-like enzyme
MSEHRDPAGDVVIRIARDEEGDAVGVLTELVYREGGLVGDDYAGELRAGEARVRDATVFVAELDGRLVGSVTAALPGTAYSEISRPDELEVRMLAVADDVRRRGIADALMEAVEAMARQRRLAGVILSTAPAMHAAHRLYERRGYTRRPERDWDVGRLRLLAYQLDLLDEVL